MVTMGGIDLEEVGAALFRGRDKVLDAACGGLLWLFRLLSGFGGVSSRVGSFHRDIGNIEERVNAGFDGIEKGVDSVSELGTAWDSGEGVCAQV